MDNDRNNEYRYTVTFPQAQRYSVGDVIDFIAEVDYLRSRATASNYTRPLPVSKWTQHVANAPCVETIINEPISADRIESERAAYLKKQKASLISRIRQDVARGNYEIWNSEGDRVNELPQKDSPSTLDSAGFRTDFWWSQLSYIYKSDLQTFCRNLKIKAEFESEDHPLDFVERSEVSEGDGLHGMVPSHEGNSPSVARPNKLHAPNSSGPKWLITKFAIEAAVELHQSLRRMPSPAEVMKKLEEWTDSGNKDGALRFVRNGSVWWLPNHKKEGEEREFDVATCAKALETWKDEILKLSNRL